MVPYGPLASFEGYIEHTNEVLTQLSSEWFALRTTKSALEMVGRRRARLESDQVDVSREERDLLMRRRVAVEAGASGGRPPEAHVEAPPDAPAGAEVRYDEEGFLDIREPYAEDDDTVGAAPASSGYPTTPSGPKVLGPATVAKATASAAESKAEAGVRAKGGDAPKPPKGDSDVFARLKELERMEELEALEELDKLEELEEEEDDAGKAQDRGDGGQQPSARAAVVKSPADLFKMMSQVEDASSEAGAALPAEQGVTGPKGDHKAARAPDDAARPKATDSGFARDILERVGSASIPAASAAASSTQTGPPRGTSESADSASAADAGNAAPKRISKFKAERQRARG
mmetsp:Transcript_45418/g.91678  ORF Transcript_45418/g.91678 Transcript_45418/m.91678 type:complete len:346 (+) Transcript_45418:168-1205(+)